ncbi:MAG: hypothetical protein V1909_07045 [Candidatus Micrarchaeota archaeon]
MKGEKTRIIACLQCGGRNLDFTPGDGMMASTYLGIGPLGGIGLCKDCGRQGGPIEFETQRDYGAFVKHLQKLKGKRRL